MPAQPIIWGWEAFHAAERARREAAAAVAWSRPKTQRWWYFTKRFGTEVYWRDREPSGADVIFWAGKGWDLVV